MIDREVLEYDIVRVNRGVPAFGVTRGMTGTVVHIHDGILEVEFDDLPEEFDDYSGVVSFHPADVTVVWRKGVTLSPADVKGVLAGVGLQLSPAREDVPPFLWKHGLKAGAFVAKLSGSVYLPNNTAFYRSDAPREELVTGH